MQTRAAHCLVNQKNTLPFSIPRDFIARDTLAARSLTLSPSVSPGTTFHPVPICTACAQHPQRDIHYEKRAHANPAVQWSIPALNRAFTEKLSAQISQAQFII